MTPMLEAADKSRTSIIAEILLETNEDDGDKVHGRVFPRSAVEKR